MYQKSINIIALNTKNITTNTTYINHLLNRHNNTILFVCETWLTNGNEHLARDTFNYNYNFIHKCSESKEFGPGRPHGGIGWILNKHLTEFSAEHQSEHVSILKSEKLAIIGVYLPTGHGTRIFENELFSITSVVEELERIETPYIIIGDFNADIDRAREINNQDKILKTWYINLYSKFGIIWVSKLYLQRNRQTYNSGSCIDHIFVGIKDKLIVEQTNIINNYNDQHISNNSDHNAIEIAIKIESNTEQKSVNENKSQTREADPEEGFRQKPAHLDWTYKANRVNYEKKLIEILKQEDIITKSKQITTL